MKRHHAVLGLAFFTMCAFCSAPVRAQTLLNPSFEDTETELANPYGDIAAHWGRWGNWMNRETGWDPTKSGECLIGYHHWEINEDDSSGVYQDIPNVPPGTPCTFSVAAFRDEGSNFESVELRIEQLGGFDTYASRIYSGEEIRKNGWGRISVSGTVLKDGVRVVIEVTPRKAGGRRGAVKFDDAELTFHNPE